MQCRFVTGCGWETVQNGWLSEGRTRKETRSASPAHLDQDQNWGLATFWPGLRESWFAWYTPVLYPTGGVCHQRRPDGALQAICMWMRWVQGEESSRCLRNGNKAQRSWLWFVISPLQYHCETGMLLSVEERTYHPQISTEKVSWMTVDRSETRFCAEPVERLAGRNFRLTHQWLFRRMLQHTSWAHTDRCSSRILHNSCRDRSRRCLECRSLHLSVCWQRYPWPHRGRSSSNLPKKRRGSWVDL